MSDWWQEQPYHADRPTYRSLCEAKRRRAGLILRWGIAWESSLLFLAIFPVGFLISPYLTSYTQGVIFSVGNCFPLVNCLKTFAEATDEWRLHKHATFSPPSSYCCICYVSPPMSFQVSLPSFLRYTFKYSLQQRVSSDENKRVNGPRYFT